MGAGYGFGYPEAAVLGVGCLLAVAAALVRTGRSPRLAARAPGHSAEGGARGPRGRVGHPLQCRGAVSGRGLEVVDRCGELPLVLRIPPLAAGAEHTVRYALPTGRRGRIALGPLRLERTDPLGLARRVRVFGPGEGGTDTLLAAARVCPLPVLPSGTAHHVEGPTSDTANEGSADLPRVARVRARATICGGCTGGPRPAPHRDAEKKKAAGGRLTAAHHPRPGHPYRCLPHEEDDFELAVDCAASVAFAAARSHFPVDVLSETGTVKGKRGKRTVTGGGRKTTRRR